MSVRKEIRRLEGGIKEITYKCDIDGSELMKIYTDEHSMPSIYVFSCSHYDWGYAPHLGDIPPNALTYVKGALFYFYIIPSQELQEGEK